MFMTFQIKALTFRFQKCGYVFMQAIWAGIDCLARGLIFRLISIHNTAAHRGVQLPFFPAIQFLDKYSILFLKKQILFSELRISLNKQRQIFIESYFEKYRICVLATQVPESGEIFDTSDNGGDQAKCAKQPYPPGIE